MRSMRNDLIKTAPGITYPEMLQNEMFLHLFSKNHEIESRLMRTMRNDLTKTAPGITYLETLQNIVF